MSVKPAQTIPGPDPHIAFRIMVNTIDMIMRQGFRCRIRNKLLRHHGTLENKNQRDYDLKFYREYYSLLFHDGKSNLNYS